MNSDGIIPDVVRVNRRVADYRGRTLRVSAFAFYLLGAKSYGSG